MPARFRARPLGLDDYRRLIKCQSACPVQTDARAYVNAIARGDDERAYRIARQSNPFTSVCGRVCGAPCEAACRRGAIDAPVAIRALKRFVNDRFGVWSPRDSRPAGDLGNSRLPSSLESLQELARTAQRQGRVAVVGAGPAGLAAAHDLRLLGHRVTVLDAAPRPGGMMVLGIPAYRLPRELLEAEIQAILDLGVDLRLNAALGRDYRLADLRRDHDAVFLAIGTYQARRLRVEGEELDGVLRAVEFLMNANLQGYTADLGARVLVIGGGSVAMDVARIALRHLEPAQVLERQDGAPRPEVSTALDAARTALRLGATREVQVLVVEARHEMLADPFEIEEAEVEGVAIHNHLAPLRVEGRDGRVAGLVTLQVERAFDDQGRFRPVLLPGTERFWPADSVIVSIGQTGELGWLEPRDGLEATPQGTLKVDPLTLATTSPGIFAGGDIAFGPRLLIHAIANGQQAALAIHAHLQGADLRLQHRGQLAPIRLKGYWQSGPRPGYLGQARHPVPALPIPRRIGIAQVELGYDQPQARAQADRCLVCSTNPVFNGELCILCGACVDVCPMSCLKLVDVARLDGDQSLQAVVGDRLGGEARGAAMLLDPERCIRCALCAARARLGSVLRLPRWKVAPTPHVKGWARGRSSTL